MHFKNTGSEFSSTEVEKMFDEVSKRYILTNRLLSLGLDILWRKKTASLIKTSHPKKILDLATGSGDLAICLKRACPNSTVIGVDLSDQMLAIAKKRGICVQKLDAQNLPFSDGEFDAVTVGFGFRNFNDWERGAKEAFRVLKNGGIFIILDFSLPSSSFLRGVYILYLKFLLPYLGSFLSGRRGAYAYLSRSILSFPSGKGLLSLLGRNGFQRLKHFPLSGGVVSIYLGEKGFISK